MPEPKSHRFHLPRSRPGRFLFSVIITALVGFVYFYFSLPAINPQDGQFYTFLGLLCLVYILCVSLLNVRPADNVVRSPGQLLREWLHFVRRHCLPVGLVFAAVVVIAIFGEVISMPIFRAGAYQKLLDVRNGDFTSDVAQISFNEIPTLDRDSANYLGDRQMGTLSDMVSQFEYSNDSTQINYQGRPVRVAPIAYADLIKWFTNRGNGLPAYVVVDMVTQEATVTRLTEGIKYSFSEPLNRNIYRHLRFHYPTMMFSTPEFEIDEEGHPWWIAPRMVKTIGLFGGRDIQGAVLVDAVTGDCQYYEQVPTWVDTLYTPTLIMEQYDYHGTLVHGFINSILGQRDVTMTTEGYNYIAMNDDVYAYTGVTSANADQSNLGFLLTNMRTKETHYYVAPGATETAAQRSAEGVVQDLGYVSTFPLLLNISGEPTYFIPLMDATSLVKSYAMVNVAQYQIVATGSTVSECERTYIQMLSDRGFTQPEQAPVAQDEARGTVEEIRTAVLSGTSWYYIRLTGEDVFYAISATACEDAIVLSPGDSVVIQHEVLPEGEEPGPILQAYELTITSSQTQSGQTSQSGQQSPSQSQTGQQIPVPSLPDQQTPAQSQTGQPEAA